MFGNRSEMLDVYRQQAFVNVFTQFAVSGEFVNDGLESHQVADQFALGRGHAHAPGHRNENFAQQPLKFIFFFQIWSVVKQVPIISLESAIATANEWTDAMWKKLQLLRAAVNKGADQ